MLDTQNHVGHTQGMNGSETRGPVMTQVTHVQRECTEAEGQLWQERHGDGYRAGRGDGRWNRAPRIDLIDIPPELPGECGAQYVARHVGIAWEIGYTHAYRYEAGR